MKAVTSRDFSIEKDLMARAKLFAKSAEKKAKKGGSSSGSFSKEPVHLAPVSYVGDCGRICMLKIQKCIGDPASAVPFKSVDVKESLSYEAWSQLRFIIVRFTLKASTDRGMPHKPKGSWFKLLSFIDVCGP
ncbi:hypothetical protein MTR67_040127 [Solanum verrucosum]|uniref:Uncharacterized protein n=1 Tax=Solanum verrucosum TaxID=315347 RepID=A0AAF0ZP63_SOLVR|nr:hypothetical protein MTR67_040127 [Solanum verrucosum]